MTKALICRVPNCDKPRRVRDKYCCLHESRMRAHGSFDLPSRVDKIAIEMIGRKFGRLTCIGEVGKSGGKRQFSFQCDCGNLKIGDPYAVRGGRTVSCGCKSRENSIRAGKNSATHGDSKSRGYRVYRMMLNRCYNPSVERYKSYGGRGIVVCDRWRGDDGYENYKNDMGERPSPLHSVDRIDVNGSYSPENCRWATRSEQANNKQDSSVVTYKGNSQTLAQWQAETGIRALNIFLRIKHGWTAEKALTTPTRQMLEKPSLSEGGHKSKSSEYGIWMTMRRRCHNSKDRAFPNYGGRGILMCERWLESFEAFYSDVGPRPKGLSLDRIDNDKGYYKENCRWTDRITQNNNKRRPLARRKKIV